MTLRTAFLGLGILICALMFLSTSTQPLAAQDDKGEKSIVSLRDFSSEEVKGAGFILRDETPLHVVAEGGGERRALLGVFDADENPQLYAFGWIINADTRRQVWRMTFDNTEGRRTERTFNGDVTLPKGAYEVYFAAYAYERASGIGSEYINIDHRQKNRQELPHRNGFERLFGDDDEDAVRDFMADAKHYHITISAAPSVVAGIRTFAAPKEQPLQVFGSTGVGDGAVVRKVLSLTRELPLHIYALGEGTGRDAMFDYGWIVNADTRQRVWQMKYFDCDRAGGSRKNLRYDESLRLPNGAYEVYYVTDDSHSAADWNSAPPSDPFRYGITVSVEKEDDKSAVAIKEIPPAEKNLIVGLTKVGDKEFRSAGFSLNEDADLRIYAIGESDNDGRDLADRGWIVNAKTREGVWEMRERRTVHAGGASKNRMADEIVRLPKGKYLVYYQTDDSHAYGQWNDDPPFDPEHYGISVYGAGSTFDMKNTAAVAEPEEEGVVAQVTRVRDNEHLRKIFTLEKPTKVRVLAIGEGSDGEMDDYGWIRNSGSGKTVWEMTYSMTTRAGGARKNRMVEETLMLDKGEYELNFRTDDSHSFGEWNADPPDDQLHWGISVYRAEEP